MSNVHVLLLPNTTANVLNMQLGPWQPSHTANVFAPQNIVDWFSTRTIQRSLLLSVTSQTADNSHYCTLHVSAECLWLITSHC